MSSFRELETTKQVRVLFLYGKNLLGSISTITRLIAQKECRLNIQNRQEIYQNINDDSLLNKPVYRQSTLKSKNLLFRKISSYFEFFINYSWLISLLSPIGPQPSKLLSISNFFNIICIRMHMHFIYLKIKTIEMGCCSPDKARPTNANDNTNVQTNPNPNNNANNQSANSGIKESGTTLPSNSGQQNTQPQSPPKQSFEASISNFEKAGKPKSKSQGDRNSIEVN